MFPLRLTLNDSIDDHPDRQTFLFYFGLPNSPILRNDDDDSLISTTTDSDQIDSIVFPVKSETVVYQTVSTKLRHKFFAFDPIPFEEIPAELFFQTCEEYLSVISIFNTPIFSPFKSDIDRNISKLRKKLQENPKKFQTLIAIVNDEIEHRTTEKRNSATDALLWLKRALELVACLLHEFGMGNKTFSEAIHNAYDRSLKHYHGFFARGIFSIALRAVPSDAEFIRSLALNPADASEPEFRTSVSKEMVEHASSMFSVLNKITLFYHDNCLESVGIIH